MTKSSIKLPSGFDTPILIGHGSFGTVYRVRQKQLDRQVIIKMIPVSKKEHRNQQFQEAVTQARLHLPYSPQVYNVFIWKKNVCIVMQWIRSLNLNECASRNLDRNTKLVIADGIIKAVSALHEKGYAHRDLKPENILVSPSDGIYLIDFGFAIKNHYNKENENVIRGTAGYIAPELFEKKNEKTDYLRADCYALGIILKDMIGFDNQYSVLQKLIDPDPENRPATATEVFQIWKDLTSEEIDFSQYTQNVDKLIRSTFSAALNNSSHKLLELKRYNEAYRLCLECLNEVPDNTDTIKLIGSFGNTDRKFIRAAVVIPGVLLVSGILSVTAFFIMRKQQIPFSSLYSISSFNNEKRVVRSLSALKNDSYIEYRYHPEQTPCLTADIYFHLDSDKYMVFIDGNCIGKKESVIQCNLPAGKYRISYVGIDNKFLASELLEVLPFRQIHLKFKYDLKR